MGAALPTGLLRELRSLRRKAVSGDVYTPDIALIARRIGADQELAESLWALDDKAARNLALHVADPEVFTENRAERWLKRVDCWEFCDGFTGRLIRYRPYAVQKTHEWAARPQLYQRRAGFALLAQMAWQANDYPDRVFSAFLPVIECHAGDDRLHVRKAVNWALRDIGKRNPALRKKALAVAARLKKADNKTARWVGTHRMKEVEHAHTGD